MCVYMTQMMNEYQQQDHHVNDREGGNWTKKIPLGQPFIEGHEAFNAIALIPKKLKYIPEGVLKNH